MDVLDSKKTASESSSELWPAADLADPHAQVDKGRRVREMFDVIADRYDLANTVISFGMARRWRRTLAMMLQRVLPCVRSVMDVACGTGDMMIELGRVFPQAKVAGVDFSEKMLLGAKKKLFSDSFGLCQGDAMALPAGSQRFDAVTCVFGLRNFQSLSKGIEEIVRVLKPGGCLAILEFQPPNNKLFGFFFNIYFERILPVLGEKIARAGSSGAYEYLPKSVKCWHDGNFVLKLLQERGLSITEVRKMCLGSVWAIVAVK
jgi:demethylmenaquinone methyltransferase/2-methoxy-6-polyprenyl-1,4-benzoquinol methylase